MTDEHSSNRFATSFSRRSRWLNAGWTLGAIAIWLQVAINLTVRDRVPIVAMAYYAVPTIVLAVAAALMAWIGGRFGRSRRAILALQCLAITALVLWVVSNFRIGKVQNRSPGSARVVFWNVGRGWFGKSDQIAEQLKRFDADVLAIVEATPDKMQTVKYWRARLPNYSPLPLDDGIVLLVRGQATLRASGSLTNWGEFRRAEITAVGVSFDIILADIVSDPWISRRPPLRDLWQVMEKQTNRPTLVVGDFNTPPSSVCFDDWQCEWSRAWDAAGSGYQPTWPQPFPVLTLDHVWGNRRITFHRSVGEWSNCSDHRPVVVDFTVK